MTESEKKAKKKYLAKGKRMTIDFYPSEADLIAQVEKQPQKQTYIKNLIRKDMKQKERHGRWGIYEKAGVIHYKCPFCETILAYIKEGHVAPDECGCCGAKMDK